MPITVGHVLSATTPNDTNYEIQVSHWNQTHAVTFSPAGNELIKFISAGANSASSGTVNFSNSNGVSFGMDGAGVITGSHNGLTQQSTQPVAVSGQNGSYAFSTLSFSNANGVTFGTSAGSAVTASVNTSYAASNHSHGNPTLALTNISGTTASASNGLTLSLSAAAPGAATLTVSAVGNTTVNSSGTWANAVSARAYGILSIGTSNGSLLFSTPDAADFTQLSVGVSTGGNTAGNTGVFTGQVVFAGGANVTLSGSTNGGSATYSIVGGAGGGGGAAISAGTQSVSSGTVVYSNSNNISFGMSGSSRVTAQAALNLYALGNTTQNSSTVLPIDAVSFNGLGAMTVGYSNGSVQMSAPATSSLVAGANITVSTAGSTISIIGASVAAAPIGISAGTVSNTFQTVTFSNSNGISFGLGTGANAGVITGSHNAITTGRASTDGIGLNTAQSNVTWTVNSSGLSLDARGYAGTGTSATNASVTLNSNGLAISVAAGGGVTPALSGSNGSFSFSTATFGNLNGLSFYTSNGSFVGSHNGLTTARASNDAIGLNTALTAGPLAWTVNSSGLSLNASSVAGTTSGFAGNLISGSMTHNTAGLNLSLNHPAWLTTARASNDAIGLNTAQTNVTWTVNSSGLSINAAGYAGTATSNTGGAAFTLNSAGLAFNGASLAGTTSGFTGANISASITHNTAGLALSMSVAAPGAAAENNAINLLGANTAGNTTATGSTIGWSGQGVTLSGTNGSQVVISAPATSSLVAGNNMSISTAGSTITIYQPPLSQFEPYPLISSTAYSSHAPASFVFNRFSLVDGITLSNVNMLISMSGQAGSATSVASTGTARFSYTKGFTIFQRQNTGTGSTNLTTVASGSWGFTAGHSYSSTSQSFVMSWVTNSTGGTTSTNTTSNSSGWVSWLSGPRIINIPCVTSLSEGEYFIAHGQSSTNATTQSNYVLGSVSQLHQAWPVVPVQVFGTTGTAASLVASGIGHGIASAMTTNATMAASVITGSASNQIIYFNMSNA